MTMVMNLSLASFAGTLTKSIPQALLDGVNIGNGSAYIQSYDVKKFDLNGRIKTIKKCNTESECSNWSTESKVADSIMKFNENGSVEMAPVIENLRVNNQLKAAIYNT
jgi:hypothetical protein